MCNHSRYGYTITGEVMSKNVQGSIHRLRKMNAWAIQASVLDAHPEVKTIVVVDTETGIKYTVKRETFDKTAVPQHLGYGRQLALPVKYWEWEGKPVSRQEPHDPNAGRQMDLLSMSRTE